jgi:hypothetical protein
MKQAIPQNFVSLRDERREIVDTVTAAFHLNLAAKTLRNTWAIGKGPIAPIRVGTRLGWKVADIKRLLQMG